MRGQGGRTTYIAMINYNRNVNMNHISAFRSGATREVVYISIQRKQINGCHIYSRRTTSRVLGKHFCTEG